MIRLHDLYVFLGYPKKWACFYSKPNATNIDLITKNYSLTSYRRKRKLYIFYKKMTSQEKALKELIEINFVKMMDGVPVRSSIGMVENKDF